MADLLFGQSYFLRFDPKLWQAMQPYPPLGTLIAAAHLRQLGHEVAVFDAMLADGEAEWERALDEHAPRYAVLFEDNFNYLSKMCLLRMRQAALKMIAMAKATGASVVVCGADATDHCELYLEGGADYVLTGEGEATLAELIAHLEGNGTTPPDQVKGLVFRRGEALVRTPPRAVLSDLDALPFPAWELIDVARYRELWRRRHGYFSMNLVTTRGCPYHCNWCAKPIWGQTYHMRSAASVAAELKQLKADYDPDHIWFADDIMGLKRGWMSDFADRLEELDLRVPFKCLSRVDLLLRDGEIEALARAGCKIVWVGAESGSQAILDAMDKGTRVEQIHLATERLHKAGIQAGLFLQFGYPGEEWEDIEKTVQMLRQCRPDEIGMSVSYPLPGTKFYNMVRAELGEKRNWTDSADLDMMYRGRFSTDFYRQLCHVVQKEFRARRSGRLLAGLRPSELRLSHLRKAAAAGYHLGGLPFARAKLRRLAKKPNDGLAALDSGMTPEKAAKPTAQVD